MLFNFDNAKKKKKWSRVEPGVEEWSAVVAAWCAVVGGVFRVSGSHACKRLEDVISPRTFRLAKWSGWARRPVLAVALVMAMRSIASRFVSLSLHSSWFFCTKISIPLCKTQPSAKSVIIFFVCRLCWPLPFLSFSILVWLHLMLDIFFSVRVFSYLGLFFLLFVVLLCVLACCCSCDKRIRERLAWWHR